VRSNPVLYLSSTYTPSTRAQYGGNESWSPIGLHAAWAALPSARRYPAHWPSPVLDFCLIDGGHTYRLAMRDFRTLRSACRVIAFHDIANAREPGTVRLWKDLTSRASAEFAPEFTSHLCVQQPPEASSTSASAPASALAQHPQSQRVMGIGILTRRADAPSAPADG
jgi:hypothetical protein